MDTVFFYNYQELIYGLLWLNVKFTSRSKNSSYINDILINRNNTASQQLKLDQNITTFLTALSLNVGG